MSSPREQLQRALGEGYTLERELGGGGMSRVFLATERALGRRVVVKVVPADTGAVSIERFQREIQLAASLQQANIVPLLAAGDADGVPYFTMPFVDGQSLRQRLAGGEPLTLSECVSIGRDVARALSYAHTRGVVHRDIKPDNVLLSHGAAMVTDFGIAKAISAARTQGDASSPTLTQAGTAMGTPAYMAPEQVAGGEAGPATDLYAWGCLMHELLTGAPPFVRESAQQVMVAHLTAPAPSVRTARGEVPGALDRLVSRCLAKEAGDRPADADALVRELEGMLSASGGTVAVATAIAPRAASRRFGVAAVLALGALLTVGAMLARRTTDGDAAPGGAAGSAAARPSVAVLPFSDRSAGRDQEYLGDGIAETLISALANVPGLDVAARTSAFSFKGKESDVRAIAKALDVETVLEGSVQRAGDRLRVTAQLVRAADGVMLWSQTFDRGAADIFAVQDEVARAVVSALDARLLSGATTGPIGTRDPAAYDLFLQGRGLVGRRATADVTRGIDLLQQAIARDSVFAAGWAALGEAYILLAFYSDVSSAETLRRARVATERALQLEARQAQALANRAYLRLLVDWDARGSDSLFREAIAVAPGSVNARKWRADALLVLKRPKEARDETLAAYRLDPLSPIVNANVAFSYRVLGDRVNDSAWVARGLALDSRMPLLLSYRLIGALARQDSTGLFAAAEQLEQSSTRRGASVAAIRAAWRAGGPGRAAHAMAEAYERNGFLEESFTFMVRSGDRDASLRVLRALLRARGIQSALVGDLLGPFASDPEFLGAMRQAGHPWAVGR